MKININGDTSVLLPYFVFRELKYESYYVYFRCEDEIGLKVKSISITAEPLRVKAYEVEAHEDEGNKDEPHEDSLIDPSPFTPKPPYILINNTNHKWIFQQQFHKIGSKDYKVLI
jgi:hypothetical protein